MVMIPSRTKFSRRELLSEELYGTLVKLWATQDAFFTWAAPAGQRASGQPNPQLSGRFAAVQIRTYEVLEISDVQSERCVSLGKKALVPELISKCAPYMHANDDTVPPQQQTLQYLLL